MTETKILEVVLIDTANYEKTLRLDNPVDNVTLAQVRNAFSTAISEGWLFGKGGFVASVARASIIETTKTTVS